MTASSDRLRAAATAILSTATTLAPIERRLLTLGSLDADRRSTLRPGVADRMLRADITEAGQRQRDTTRRTLEALTQLCLALEAREARTALVWVSSALQLARGGPWALLLDPTDNPDSGPAAPAGGRGDPTSGLRGVTAPAVVSPEVEATLPTPELLALQQRFHEAANRSNVAVYSIDPSARSTFGIDASLEGLDGLGGSSGSSAMASLRSTRMRDAVDGLRDGFREAATDTGGKAYLYSDDLGLIMREIETDVRRAYLLTYSSPRQASDGRYHEIRVEVRYPGSRVRARRGYTDVTVTERDARRAISAVVLPGIAADLTLPMRAVRRFSPAGEMVVELAIGLDWLPMRDPSEAGPLEFHALAMGTDGQATQRIDETLTPRGFSWAQLGTYAREWALVAGAYQIRVVLADPLSGRVGAAAVDIAVPPLGGWLPSDLMLYFSDGTEPPRPLVGMVEVDDLVVAYAELSGGQAPTLGGQVLDAEGAVRLHIIDAMALTLDTEGVYRGWLPLPALSTGRYLLRIVLTDRSAGRSKIYRHALHVRPAR